MKAFQSGSVELQPSAERQAEPATGQAASENEAENGEQQQTALEGNDALFEVCNTFHSTANGSV